MLVLDEVIFLRQSVFFTCLFFTTCQRWPNLEDTINYSVVDSHNPLSLTSFWRLHTKKVAGQPSRLGLEWVQNWRKWREGSRSQARRQILLIVIFLWQAGLMLICRFLKRGERFIPQVLWCELYFGRFISGGRKWRTVQLSKALTTRLHPLRWWTLLPRSSNSNVQRLHGCVREKRFRKKSFVLSYEQGPRWCDDTKSYVSCFLVGRTPLWAVEWNGTAVLIYDLSSSFFKWSLNLLIVPAFLSDKGKLFHNIGAAFSNNQSPIVFFFSVLLTENSVL